MMTHLAILMRLGPSALQRPCRWARSPGLGICACTIPAVPAPPLVTAERALLDERRRPTREEALAVAHLPLDELPSLIGLAHQVRLAWCGPEVELESLINAKSGACPEDCAFCSQSVRFHTGVDVFAFLDVDEILDAAHATRDAGASQFCIVVAVRGPEERLLSRVIDAVGA